MASKEDIPKGWYCYEQTSDWIVPEDGSLPYYKVKMCPFWSIDPSHPRQDNGYCAYLNIGDWDQGGFGLLWDQVKACGENEYTEEELNDLPSL